jgi:hypothetical protein
MIGIRYPLQRYVYTATLSSWTDTAQVERFASAYLLRTQAGGPDERRVRTRERMKRVKDIVGRW